MPGILPMKTIKFGTTAQSRIAQACDRCRSKKIRCDGIRPCCSQCSNVGFECKTSDKLSRRAFPRGYTESLEERVRALEAEVRELKDLLDEKDEKIDILTRIDPGSATRRRSAQLPSPPSTADTKLAAAEEVLREDTFQVQQSPFLLEAENSDTYVMGASSGRAFVDTFKTKTQEMGKSYPDFKTETFFPDEMRVSLSPKSTSDDDLVARASPRLVSDQMVNIFFQEWAPLFPILHRSTFLKLYERYITDPEGIEDHQSIAQLNLVFGIAALSAEWTKQDVRGFESQWQAAVHAILSENTLATLQCLALAQIYCILKSDYSKVIHYKGVAIGLCHRLGLHQSQKRFSLGAYTTETRKKLLWTLYTVDCFSAALLGLPKLFKDSDIHTEYPIDIDDESVNGQGFQPTLPGESTRLSSALALFQVARVLSRVLDENYPAAPSHNLSLQKISALNDELENWVNSLPPHLRLHFAQDKPSTDVTSSRSPLLSLAYHYIRTLIYRPAVGSSLGSKASSAVIALAGSSKHTIQIIQLLEERRMSFSFCLNKNEVLLLSGFALLYQSLDLNRDSKLIKDSQRLTCSVVEILERNNGIGAAAFKGLACSLISIERFSKPARPSKNDPSSRKISNANMLAPKELDTSPRKQLQLIASRFSLSTNHYIKQEGQQPRRTTLPTLASGNPALYARNSSQPVLPTYIDDPSAEYGHLFARSSNVRLTTPIKPTNLDYLSFNSDPLPLHSNTTRKLPVTIPDWDNLVECLNPGQDQLYRDIVSSPDLLAPNTDAFLIPAANDWSAKTWDIVTELDRTGPANSVFSVSEESLTSGEDLSACDLASEYPGITMPSDDSFGVLDDMSGNIKLE